MATTRSLINVDVQDIMTAEAFYCGVFGFQVIQRRRCSGRNVTFAECLMEKSP